MDSVENKQYYCEKCHRTMGAEQFYTSNNLEKYPNEGKVNMCKKCMTMHVDNWNPETYLWILQEIDVPYIPDEWDKLMASYASGGKKLTNMSIIGRYLAKMKLKQHKDFRWKDNEFLKKMRDAKIEKTMKEQGYEAAEIAEAVEEVNYAVPTAVRPPEKVEMENSLCGIPDPAFADPGPAAEELGLSDEDVTYLRLKWGKTYRPEEWVSLEQLYNDMMNSYDIQGAGHEDTLKLICKTSLKCNQLIDLGDVDGFKKMSSVYDSLMKSGKFTAAQNKAENGEFVDSVGELVMLCEKEGYIERYYVSEPKDKVDETLADMKRYTQTLVNEETNLANLIENAIKQNAKEDAIEAENEEEDIVTDDDLGLEEIESELSDDDYEAFNEFLDEGEYEDESVGVDSYSENLFG